MKTAPEGKKYPDESHYNEIFKRYENNPIMPKTLWSLREHRFAFDRRSGKTRIRCSLFATADSSLNLGLKRPDNSSCSISNSVILYSSIHNPALFAPFLFWFSH